MESESFPFLCFHHPGKTQCLSSLTLPLVLRAGAVSFPCWTSSVRWDGPISLPHGLGGTFHCSLSPISVTSQTTVFMFLFLPRKTTFFLYLQVAVFFLSWRILPYRKTSHITHILGEDFDSHKNFSSWCLAHHVGFSDGWVQSGHQVMYGADPSSCINTQTLTGYCPQACLSVSIALVNW